MSRLSTSFPQRKLTSVCLQAVFIVCIAISALCQTLEIMWLKQDQYALSSSLPPIHHAHLVFDRSIDRKHLRRNAIVKWIIVVLAICCAICFGAT